MSGIIKEIDVSELLNYFENPRHAIATNEEDTLKKLFESVGNQYMLNLAEDIQQNGLIGSQQIVVVYSEDSKKYVVFEGNRRVAVIKLMLDPDSFTFLDKATIDKAKRIGQQGNISKTINCYVTDEEEAFFIMERLHSGEDKGRGTKQWTSREKEVFRVRQSHEKNISYLIDYYVKKHLDGLDITTILPFTTIQRIFNNREVKKQIGLDIANEETFTPARMQLVVAASKWIVTEAEVTGIAVTRLFNKARTIEDKLLPWIQSYQQGNTDANANTGNEADSSNAPEQETNTGNQGNSGGTHSDGANGAVSGNGNQDDRNTENPDNENAGTGSGGSKNLPYFFQGLRYGHLDPKDADTHGVSAVCREVQLFSDKKMVATYPIASAFLVRSLIEQSIIYYSKKHYIQGQNKLIWDDIISRYPNNVKLNQIISSYIRNLSNYITDDSMRKFFTALFQNYQDNVDPLNWVIHKPAEFRLDANSLLALPQRGLLALINFMLS